MDFTLSSQLHYLIHQADGEYVAHCLDMDLVGSGATIDEAVTEANTGVQALVLFALRNGSEQLLADCKQAPDEYWDMYEEAKQSGRTETRTLEVHPALQPVAVSQCHYTYCLSLAMAA